MDLKDIIGSVTDALTGKHHDEAEQDANILPASADPMGDPADQQQATEASYSDQNILPASADPYGDPADAQGQDANQNILPASADPYGDPADKK